MAARITAAEYQRLLRASKGRTSSRPRAPRGTLRKSEVGGVQSPRDGMSPPHRMLFDACLSAFGESRVHPEHPAGVPGRRFRIDIAFPSDGVAVEIDGWAYHGKHLSAHARDRERQNLLVQVGWRILRFSAGQIRNDLGDCIDQINSLLKAGTHPATGDIGDPTVPGDGRPLQLS